VSHDRSLIRATADELWLIADGTAAPFDGDLEDYRSWVEKRRAPPQAAKPAVEKPPRPPSGKKKALLSKQTKLDSELQAAQSALNEIQSQLADPDLYQNSDASVIDLLNSERDTLEQRIATLEETWLELEAALDGVN
jgi:ATP-binding cassette subfamily F protein 3